MCPRCHVTLIRCGINGRTVLLDPAQREPRLGLIAYNPATTGGRELTIRDVPDARPVAWRWAYQGVTFHAVHAEVCPAAPVASRRALGQQGLAV